MSEVSPQLRVVTKLSGGQLVEAIHHHPLLEAALRQKPLAPYDDCQPTDPRRDAGLFQCFRHDLGGSASLELITVAFDVRGAEPENLLHVMAGSKVLHEKRVRRPQLEFPGTVSIVPTQTKGYLDILLRDPRKGDHRVLVFDGEHYVEPSW